MIKSNKKGFTIVELVIVIAVIAILAAVLIPTFSTVINNAKKSNAMQKASNALQSVSVSVMANRADHAMPKGTFTFTVDYVGDTDKGYTFTYDTTEAQPTLKEAGNDKAITATGNDAVNVSAALDSGASTPEDLKGDLNGLGVKVSFTKAAAAAG